MKKLVLCTLLASMFTIPTIIPMQPEKVNKPTKQQKKEQTSKMITLYNQTSLPGIVLGTLVNLYPYQSYQARAAAIATTFFVI